MVTVRHPTPLSAKSPTPVRQASDEDLLKRIAGSHDRSAFNLIFTRYGTVALNLAQHLIGNRATAEEAVQEAMLAVWQKAGGFDPGRGSAKTWIMRIVAHKALQLTRRSKRSRRREVAAAKNAEQDHATRESRLRDREDLVAVVREKFAELPDALRQIMALYFAGDMSQEEISQTLTIPQTTVSMRIRQGVDELRARLKGAGYALALPMVTTESLGDLLQAGPEMPAEISARILQAIHAAARHSVRAAAKSSVGAAYWIGPALLVLAGAGAWVAQDRRPAQAPATAKPQAVHTPPQPAQPAATKSNALRWVWDFNTPDTAKDFKVTTGSWRFVPNGGQDGTGCMEITSEKFCAIIEMPQAPLPLALRYVTASSDADERRSGVGIARTLMTASFSNIGNAGNSKEYVEMQQFLAADFNYANCDGRFAGVVLYKLSGDNPLVFSAAGYQRVDNLEIRAADASEVPDVAKYRAALLEIPPARRQGTVVLPQLASTNPGWPVTVTFRYYDDDAKSEAWGE